MLSFLATEVRLAFRIFRRSPAYAATAIITLALGIGANALAYVFASAVFLRPMPFVNDHELVGISTTHRAANGEVMDFAASTVDFLAYETRARTLAGVGAIDSRSYALQGSERPETILGALVSASMWSVLGTPPLAGRPFGPEDDIPGSMVVVISHTLQQRLFADAPAAIGKVIVIDGSPRTIIGVMPRGFRPRMNPGEVWLPLGATTGTATTSRQLQLVGRLRHGSTIEDARADLRRIAAELAVERPDTHRDWGTSVMGLRAKIGDSARGVTLTLVAAVGFLLLLACANVTNLALVRVARRRTDVSTRLALGASRTSIVRQQMIEATLLGMAGGVLGVALAVMALPPARRVLTSDNPLISDVNMDGRVIAIVFVLSLVVGVACSIAPALYGMALGSVDGLAGGGRRQEPGRKERWMRSALMTLQVASAAVLLVGALGAAATLRALAKADIGFQSAKLFVGNVTLPITRYPKLRERALFVDQVLERLRATAGIELAALTTTRFLRGQSVQSMVTIEGGRNTEPLAAEVRRVDPQYFAALGLGVTRGRGFTSQDRDSMPPVVIVNRSFTLQYLGDREPLGVRVKRGTTPPTTIVGVVPDVMDSGVGVKVGPTIYLPYAQNASPSIAFVVRSSLGPGVLDRAMRGAIAAVDPTQPLGDVLPLNRLLVESLGEGRFKTLLLAVLSGLALIVACLGIYGVTAYIIAERTREVAIRIALGARPPEILRQFTFDATRWIALGAIGGLGIAWVLSRAVGSRVPEVASAGMVTYVGTGCLLVVVGILASLAPTLRASRMEPAGVLRG